MERVVKGFMGYGKEKEENSATHIILTVEEYEELQKNIYDLKMNIVKINRAAQEQLRSKDIDCSKQIKEIENTAQNEKNSLLSNINKITKDLYQQEHLNLNLKRICTERANAKRGIKPKKEHNGYIITRSEQYEHRYTVLVSRKNKQCSYWLWKSTIQTPFDSSMSWSAVEKEILQTLKESILFSFGIKGKVVNFSDITKDTVENTVIWNMYKARANFKGGLWEIDIFHTKPVKNA